jgi:hypothetical protein
VGPASKGVGQKGAGGVPKHVGCTGGGGAPWSLPRRRKRASLANGTVGARASPRGDGVPE